ncbi:putative cytochrome P450 6a20 isoform X2 [Temnothorax americanus]|uniref:putative cytochrome P450 6a20 isoform X2 n=1 Tax=Temnothorax americanus TaxID=1964332 RepID=UPI004067739E
MHCHVSTMVLFELIKAFIIALIITYIYYKYRFNFWKKRNVFNPTPSFPLGNLTAIIIGRKQAGVYAHDLYLKYKDHRIFGAYLLFKPILVIADLNIIQIILTKKFESFHDRGVYINEKINPLFDNLVFINGKKWENLRQKFIHTFTKENLKQMFDIVKECGEELTNYLETKAQLRDSVEMKDMFARYTTDVIMSTAFGIKSNCIEEPNNEYRKQSKNILRMKISRLILNMSMPKIMDLFSIPLIDQSVNTFYTNLFRKSVKNRRAHKEIIRHDFMHILIKLMDEGYDIESDNDEKTDVTSTVNKLTMEEATSQSFIFFLAGFETSAATSMFAMYELAENQDLQNKVRQEIDEILTRHGDLTYDAVKEMIYLQKVINETLRKYPPIPMLNRICTKDIDLPIVNIRIPKGMPIVIPVLGLHRDPSIYPDPERFDPERFAENEKAKRHRYAFLPFGEGRRICIGRQFGSMVTKIGLASLLSKYKFKPHPRTAKPFVYNEKSFGLAIKGGVHLIIEQR